MEEETIERDDDNIGVWKENYLNRKNPDVIPEYLKNDLGTSLVEQWLRVRLPMQGTRVRSLIREDPRASEQLSPRATTTEARALTARAPQQEKPPQWEARAPQWRAAPARRN